MLNAVAVVPLGVFKKFHFCGPNKWMSALLHWFSLVFQGKKLPANWNASLQPACLPFLETLQSTGSASASFLLVSHLIWRNCQHKNMI